MTGREFAPGTVAVATVRGVEGVRVIRNSTSRWFTGEHVSGQFWHEDGYVTDVRPLVVLDLNYPAHPLPEHFVSAIKNILRPGSYSLNSFQVEALDYAARQIEEQTRPPKPEEPTGDGAVVEDCNGYRWVRIAGDGGGPPWRHRGHTARDWECVNAMRVLSEGVQP